MFSFAVWAVLAVAAWLTVVAVLCLTLLRPSARRDKAERDVWVQFEQATGRHE